MPSPDRPTTATSLPTHMRAAVLDHFGRPEQLTVRSIPVPTIGDSDVRLRVDVAGVGSWDAEEREGDYEGAFGVPSTFPYILGWDAAGTVVDVGRDVTRHSVGDRVYAATMPVPRGGFYAEFGVVDAEQVSPIPSGLPASQANAPAWGVGSPDGIGETCSASTTPYSA